MIGGRPTSLGRSCPDDVRRVNRALVLETVKRNRHISRASLARTTGLARATVSVIVDELLGAGLLREAGKGDATAGRGAGGRPPVLLEFVARSQVVVGVHIGVHSTKVASADALGCEITRLVHDTPHADPSRALDEVAAAVKSVLADTARAADAVAVCLPGLVEPETGVCELAPNLGWHDVPVRRILETRLRSPVTVHNVTHAVAAREYSEGAAQGSRLAAVLYVGTGIGAAIVVDGEVLVGVTGLAGEIGHCPVFGARAPCRCGRFGCLETVAAAHAIVRGAEDAIARGAKTSLRAPITPEAVSHAAAHGDHLASQLLAAAGTHLGTAAAWLIDLVNPDTLLVAGGLANAGDALLTSLVATATARALPQAARRVRISRAAPGDEVELRGALILASRHASGRIDASSETARR